MHAWRHSSDCLADQKNIYVCAHLYIHKHIYIVESVQFMFA